MGKKVLVFSAAMLLIGAFTVTVFAQNKVISVEYGEPWKDLFESAIEEFEETTGAQVNRILISSGIDMWQRIVSDFEAGIAADIIMVDGFMIADSVEAGYLYQLDDYVRAWRDWFEYYPTFRAMGSYKDHTYAITLETSANAILWYWKPNFKRAGIAMPWKPKDWDEVLETAERIKQRLPDVEYPLFLPMGTKWGEGATCSGIYSEILGADTSAGDRNRLRNYSTGKWIGSSPAIERALNFYREVFWVRKLGSTEAMYASDVWGEWRRLMRAGDIGIGQGGSWEWAEFWPETERPLEEERGDFLGWAPLPGSGDPGTPPIQTISGGWTVAMNATVKDPDLAWEFLKILNSKERLAKWLATAGKLSMRKDSAEVAKYAQNDFLMTIGNLLPFSTYRDAVAGYTTVSGYLQQAMEKVAVDGVTAAEAMQWYKNKLIEEFGEDQVEIISS